MWVGRKKHSVHVTKYYILKQILQRYLYINIRVYMCVISIFIAFLSFFFKPAYPPLTWALFFFIFFF